MLADTVEVVIGVDTHKHTHTAAVVVAATGAAIDDATVGTDLGGYAALLAMGVGHSGLRAWAIEGTGGYGAGLARYLAERGEAVIELDRPNRPARRNGAKSDPLDAIRAAREALARRYRAQPRTGAERGALSVRMAARRSAVEGATLAQRQLHALVTAAPEPLRAKFRGQSTRTMLATATRLRTQASWDIETTSTATVLRGLARRCHNLEAEANDHEQAIRHIIASWRPDLLNTFGVGPIVAAAVLCAWSHPRRCRNDAAFANLAGVAPIPRQQRTDRPLAAQPLRRPPTQPRPTRHRPQPAPLRPRHPRLRRAPPNRRQDRPRDPPLPQALHRPPALPTTRTDP
jgi:transposase